MNSIRTAMIFGPMFAIASACGGNAETANDAGVDAKVDGQTTSTDATVAAADAPLGADAWTDVDASSGDYDAAVDASPPGLFELAKAHLRECELLSDGEFRGFYGDSTDALATCLHQRLLDAPCEELEGWICGGGIGDLWSPCYGTPPDDTMIECLDHSNRYWPSSQCDGLGDCFDLSDEAGCPTFACGDADATVVAASMRCDGDPSCPNGADEAGCGAVLCSTEPPSPEFRAGAACTTSEDCHGGFCLFDGASTGICSAYCRVDSQCGPGGYCGDGACSGACSADTDCASGRVCRDDPYSSGPQQTCVVRPSPADAAGGPCATAADCGSSSTNSCRDVATYGYAGGYCTGFCTTDESCAPGDHCAWGTCVKSCGSSADCRGAGYACQDFDSDGRTECWSSGTGTSAVGGPCSSVADCAGGNGASCVVGANVAGGYCSLACDAASPCPSGSSCRRAVCSADCTTDSDCRLGYACATLFPGDTSPVCVASATGAGAIGDACTSITECAGGTRGRYLTNSWYPGGYCSLSCATDSECGSGAACYGSTCVGTCTTDADCSRPGYRCVEGTREDGTTVRMCEGF
jgi:hypothetical protein